MEVEEGKGIRKQETRSVTSVYQIPMTDVTITYFRQMLIKNTSTALQQELI